MCLISPTEFSFDRIGELMGVPSMSFLDTHPTKVNDILISLFDYVQAIDKIKNPQNSPQAAADTINRPIPHMSLPIQLEISVGGHMILPDPIPSDGWKKVDWDRLFTQYVSQRYHLACGGIEKHIPYKIITTNQKDFIEPKYLPRRTLFRPPRNIVINDMKSIFDHFLKRQRKYGPEETFNFKSIQLKKEIVPAQNKFCTVNANRNESSDETNLCNRPPSGIPSDTQQITNPVAGSNGTSPQLTNSCSRSSAVPSRTQDIPNETGRCNGTGVEGCPVPGPTSGLPDTSNTNDIADSSPVGDKQPRPRPRPRPILKRITRSDTQGTGPGN